MTPLRPLLERPETYARARLRLGMAGVGVAVVMALTALISDLPTRLFSRAGGGFFEDASLMALWLAGMAVFTLPFEFFGGYRLPKVYGRKHRELDEWFLAWLKGTLVLLVLMSFAGAATVFAGRFGGRIGATGMVGMLAAGLIAGQRPLAQMVGTLRRTRAGLDALDDEIRRLGVVTPDLLLLESEDEGFTGGIAGLPTAERIVLPLAWMGRFEPERVALLVARRVTIVDRGLRALGLAAALAWTLLIFALATLMPGSGVGNVPEFLATSLWFVLFSFVGLLVLPTPSRAATLAADACLLEDHPESRAAFEEVVAGLDRLQDDEPVRAASVERIFHPIPNVTSRVRAMGSAKGEIAPWHLARAAIQLSIVVANPLARLVHCNVGRPDLWVYMPTDG